MVKAHIEESKFIYVHRDLFNAAYFFKTQIERKIQNNDIEGIAYEYMSCLIMLSFGFEAKLNFIGHKLINNWKERQAFDKKLRQILLHLKISPDFNLRPFSSIHKLKEFRDLVAHGKPVETEIKDIVNLTEEDISRGINLDGQWLLYCTKENVFNVYEDIELIKKTIIDKSGIPPSDRITRGSRGLKFL